jgi:(S)-ureidoglycine aminohydrolase
MKSLIGLFVFITCFQVSFSQSLVETAVYDWNPSGTILNGSGAVLSSQQLSGHTIRGGKRRVFQSASNGPELFFIIKYGPVDVMLNGATRRLDKGSVVFVLPGDEVAFRNPRKDDVEIYEMRMTASDRDESRGTQLNPGLSSHPPHTHQNEEIILMIDGEGEMILGSKPHRIVTGQTAWVASMLPHNITNIGKRPALYFAIQWN